MERFLNRSSHLAITKSMTLALLLSVCYGDHPQQNGKLSAIVDSPTPSRVTLLRNKVSMIANGNIDTVAKDDRNLEKDTIWETIEALLNGELIKDLSMPLHPSTSPSDIPSLMMSDLPSIAPTFDTTSDATVTTSPSQVPINDPTSSSYPSSNDAGSSTPTRSMEPSSLPSSGSDSEPTTEPLESMVPTPDEDVILSVPPTDFITIETEMPSSRVSSRCPGFSESQRIEQILARLDAVVQNPDAIRDNTIPQGMATTWFIENDQYDICPDDDTCSFIQRWVLAVIYYSTSGDSWFQCSASSNATDQCGSEPPFESATRFLSPVDECSWAGITCIDGCVTEIEYELNNLVGTIPTEMGLLSDLIIWGMERGNLTGPIPTEIGQLSQLIFIDLDFNKLTGTLSSELFGLSNLTQLDLNDNLFSGTVDGIENFPFMEFLQLHRNNFTGTIPNGIGLYTDMTAFTIHETNFTGTMPLSICNLVLPGREGGNFSSAGNGVLSSLIADCAMSNQKITCECCTDCRDP